MACSILNGTLTQVPQGWSGWPCRWDIPLCTMAHTLYNIFLTVGIYGLTARADKAFK